MRALSASFSTGVVKFSRQGFDRLLSPKANMGYVHQISRVSSDLVAREYSISSELIIDVVQLLENSCQDLRARIIKEVADLRARNKKAKAKARTTSHGKSKKPGDTTSESAASGTEDESLPPTLILQPQRSPTKSAFRRTESSSSILNPQTPRRRVAFTQLGAADLTSREAVLAELSGDEPEETPTKAKVSASKRRQAVSGSETESDGALPSVTTPRTGKAQAKSLSETPSRSTRSPTKPIPQTPTTPRARSKREPSPSTGSESSDDGIPPPRRIRPMFADRKQWATRDPRAEREWTAAHRAAQRWIAEHGHPFGALKLRAQQVDMDVDE
jgi:hypothetical protein